MYQLRLVLLALLFVSLGTTQAQEEVIDGVFTRLASDPFTDESTALLVSTPIGSGAPSRTTRTYTQAECTNGTLGMLMFEFRDYMVSSGFGTLEYRVDGGQVRSSDAFVSGSSAVLWHRSSDAGDDTEVIRALLSGSEVAVRASAEGHSTGSAVYDLAHLSSVMSEVGCAY